MKQFIYLHKSKRSFFLFLLGMLLSVIFFIVTIYILQHQLGEYFLSVFEKKTLDNLQTYHASEKKSVSMYFKKSVEVIESMAQNDIIITDSPQVQRELERQQKLYSQFQTLALINDKGIVQHIVSTDSKVATSEGTNVSSRDYVRQSLVTKETYISKPIIGLLTQTALLNISVPVIQKGKITAILSGFINLKHLSDDLVELPTYYEKYSVLTDLDGTVIVGDIPWKQTLINVAEKEPLYRAITQSSRLIVTNEEYNFMGDMVLAMGEKISITHGKDMLLFSFLRKNAYESEKVELNYTIYKVAAYLIFFWLMFYGCMFILLSILFYNHEKREEASV